MQNKHPNSLWILCFTETWERYGFYVLQSLIALYISLHFGMNDAEVYFLVGAFTALSYISPIVGGWISDHYLGQKQSVLFGLLLLAASYLGLAWTDKLSGIYPLLAGVALGTGLLKPNLSSLLGRQYDNDTEQRNSGFTLFYMGINLGIFLGTSLPSKIQAIFGWHACFFSAAIGIFIALALFTGGSSYIITPNWLQSRKTNQRISDYILAGIIALSFYLIARFVLLHQSISNIFFYSTVFLGISYIFYTIFHERDLQRKQTITYFLLLIISTCFWSFYFQIFMSLTLFISRCVQPQVFGINVPAPYYIAVQSLGIVVFGFVLQKFWKKRGNTKKNTSIAYNTSITFFLSILTMIFVYSLILLAISSTAPLEKISPWLILLAYLLISLAELLISPIGLASVSSLVRTDIVGTMMGIFFVSLGLGGFFAGKLSSLTTIKPGQDNLATIKAVYFQGFLHAIALLVAVLILALCVIAATRYIFRSKK